MSLVFSFGLKPKSEFGPNWKIKKITGFNPILLQNFRIHKNKIKSKRWALYFKNWASYRIFRESSRGKISVLPIFQISKPHSVFEILTEFFACELHFYRGLTSKWQLWVLHNSFIDFVHDENQVRCYNLGQILVDLHETKLITGDDHHYYSCLEECQWLIFWL